MAGLCWVAVVLAFFLSAGNSLDAVDQNWLTSIIDGIKNEYALGDTFSLAVNVPQNQDPNTLQQVFQDDPADKVIQTVSGGQVYQGTRVVAAAGAVARVLENIQPLIKSSQGNFLVIYSEESPTANEDGVAGKVNDVIQNWSGYAFVFSKVVNVPDADVSQLSESFKQLGISKFGLDNIFRCYKPGDDPFQCTSCSSGGDVAPTCVADNSLSNQEQGVGGEVSTVPPGAGTDTGLSSGTGGGREKEKGRQVKVSRCKGRKRGCKRRKGGKVRKGRKQRGGKGKKWGKVRRGRRGKGKKGRKGKKWGKARGGRRGKGRRGGKGKKSGKRRGGWGKKKGGFKGWGLQ
ncbi:keratin, type II cytoskeletal 2 epidermal-like [Siniperca chuatsi]|uniref:keratin, type II cytoskeletal 2 epidermal-like n=1 Tax=Siniperca chuatsi TaxID=119488 RepID=UPI001CE11DF5|nr:keratin, type II cytoskeletal 2 epidermal-like [Siniperca chuatsi]XP_044045427.1 keratin, type II cytoskeletal 2 epidermal-like [Siniperca chuatsi]